MTLLHEQNCMWCLTGRTQKYEDRMASSTQKLSTQLCVKTFSQSVSISHTRVQHTADRYSVMLLTLESSETHSGTHSPFSQTNGSAHGMSGPPQGRHTIPGHRKCLLLHNNMVLASTHSCTPTKRSIFTAFSIRKHAGSNGHTCSNALFLSPNSLTTNSGFEASGDHVPSTINRYS